MLENAVSVVTDLSVSKFLSNSGKFSEGNSGEEFLKTTQDVMKQVSLFRLNHFPFEPPDQSLH